MSASSFTDWSVTCDGIPTASCAETFFVSGVDSVRDVRGLRKVLKGRGWTVGVPAGSVPGFGWADRPLDFCPDHKPEEA